MAAAQSLIGEIEEVARKGSAEWRARMLERIAALFLAGADRFNEEHVELFDDVLGRLIVEIETRARAELAARLAPVANAPAGVIRSLATDSDIEVARPVLAQSAQLSEQDLVEIAESHGQGHLLAIADRADLGEAVTNVLVARGDRRVVHHVAENATARLSDDSFSTLVKRSERDGVLAEKVGGRPDIPPRLFRELLLRATDVVRDRLLASARPDIQDDIRQVLAKISGEVGAREGRDFAAASRTVEALAAAGGLDEDAMLGFARDGRFEETAVCLSMLSDVPLDTIDRLMSGERPDPILILCRASGWDWPTARALMAVRPASVGGRAGGIDTALANFERLAPATAQRVVRFWQVRPDDASAG
ncbi:MAG TPA: DUF2336 domain-containing protein [Xanthobacteraceae bacterium]|nr:DUF2336 domain-containing protein [Xanthobacteraceae bacterium]